MIYLLLRIGYRSLSHYVTVSQCDILDRAGHCQLHYIRDSARDPSEGQFLAIFPVCNFGIAKF